MTELLSKVSGSGPVRRLKILIIIEAPIGQVWEAISTSEGMEKWWTGGNVEAKEGSKIVLEDGTSVHGTVKICNPPYLFAFSWNDKPTEAAHPHLIDEPTKSSIIFELVESGPEQTELKFSQYLPPEEIVGAAAGWHQILGERLKGYLETGEAPDHEDRFAELQKLYEEAGVS